MKSYLIAIFVVLFGWEVSAVEINRQAMKDQRDLAGSKDHPMISRIPDSWIVQYEAKAFDEVEIILGKALRQKNAFEKSDRVEGKVTRIGYAFPEGRSTLEVLRQYQTALQKVGFQQLYSCTADECGGLTFVINWEKLPGETSACYFYGCKDDTVRYYAARWKRAEGDMYVTLMVFTPVAHAKNVIAFLRIIEVKPMEEGLVTVDAAAMARDIQSQGHIAIYGIYFDFNKADIKPESQATIAEIAKLLKQNSDMKLYLVGHTDNQGTLPYNMDLSQRRAEAVVRSLTRDHGISAARMVAKGVGPLAPIASNASEDGRAKNRRVELVQQ
ncbi:DUF4892 domain-containing protein [bacterium]|nr:DUF4892 domain-containing protein [bacterium]MCI0601648.1 DUF4892 domain-containing protein [bacterium]